MSRLNSLNSSQPRHPTLSSSTLLDSRSIYLMAADERNHRSSGMTGVSVFTELQKYLARTPASASSERCHKWFSRVLLAAMLFSRSVDSCFHVFVCQSQELDFVLELQQQVR